MDPASAAASSTVRRPTWIELAVAALVVLVTLAGFAAHRWYRDRAYIGTTSSVVLEWTCGNGIFWHDGSGRTWWAGHDPMPTGRLSPTVDPPGTFPVPKQALGRLHFASYTTAVFTSQTGARLMMFRQRKNAFYTADCAGTGQPSQ